MPKRTNILTGICQMRAANVTLERDSSKWNQAETLQLATFAKAPSVKKPDTTYRQVSKRGPPADGVRTC